MRGRGFVQIVLNLVLSVLVLAGIGYGVWFMVEQGNRPPDRPIIKAPRPAEADGQADDDAEQARPDATTVETTGDTVDATKALVAADGDSASPPASSPASARPRQTPPDRRAEPADRSHAPSRTTEASLPSPAPPPLPPPALREQPQRPAPPDGVEQTRAVEGPVEFDDPAASAQPAESDEAEGPAGSAEAGEADKPELLEPAGRAAAAGEPVATGAADDAQARPAPRPGPEAADGETRPLDLRLIGTNPARNPPTAVVRSADGQLHAVRQGQSLRLGGRRVTIAEVGDDRLTLDLGRSRQTVTTAAAAAPSEQERLQRQIDERVAATAAEPVEPRVVYAPGELDQEPRITDQVAPEMTRELRRQAPARVIVAFIVDDQGNVEHAAVQHATDPAFEAPALEAVRQWRFEPGTHDGQPVPFRMRVPITFKR